MTSDARIPPPQPPFLKVRVDQPRVLTPLRRRMRDVYVRATERGWFGLIPLETHVVICGVPRSGTTLLQLMLERSAVDAKSFGRERSALSVARYTWPGRHRILISKKPDDIFRVEEIRQYYRSLQTNVRFVLSVRDPRAVMTSIFVDKPGYCVPPIKWCAVYDHIQYQSQFDDVMLTEYRDLVERPDMVRERLASFTGCRIGGEFETFDAAVPGHFDTRALNGVRPLDRASLLKWQAPEHRARVQDILSQIPDLPQRLIDMGYETDTSWAREYR